MLTVILIGECMGHKCIVNSSISVHLLMLLPLCIIVMYIWKATFVYYIEASPALTGIHMTVPVVVVWCKTGWVFRPA